MLDVLGQPSHLASLPVQFARAARLALAGLILPPALLSVSSAVGYPFRSGVGPLTWTLALAGFAAAGWMAARSLATRRDVAVKTAAAFAAGGAIVAPAFHALQGLSGHESPVAVIGAITGGFALGFGLAGAATASIAGGRGSVLRIAAWISVLGGGLGGLIALLPQAWLRLGPIGPLAGYAQMAVAVLSVLGCVLVPFRLIGTAVARVRPSGS